MSDEQRILGFIGLAMKAGAVESGFDQVVSSVKSGKAGLLIISKDISRGTMDKFLSELERCGREIPGIYSFSDKRSLGNAIGRSDRGILAIKGEGFCSKLDSMLAGFDDKEEKV